MTCAFEKRMQHIFFCAHGACLLSLFFATFAVFQHTSKVLVGNQGCASFAHDRNRLTFLEIRFGMRLNCLPCRIARRFDLLTEASSDFVKDLKALRGR